MKRQLLLVCMVVVMTTVSAQKIPLINSGEVIDRGKKLYDSGNSEAAILKYLTVPKRDTNYVYMLTELALTYMADEQYEKAIATCDEALATPSINRSHLLRTKCVALDKKGSYDESVSLFKKSIEEYPLDHRLIYNLGITYYNHQEHDKAVDCFFQVLAINPFHSGSHLNLGRMSVGHGRKTHAMLSLGVYLAVSNTDNERLVYADKFLSNQLEEEGQLTATDVNGCEKLDQIIRSKVAMDKNFKSSMPIEAPVVKQYEMFFQQLNLLSINSEDRWLQYYLPLYKAIREQNMTETYLYHILASTNNDQVKKWRQKNDKLLSAFYSLANKELSRKREIITAPASWGFDQPVQAWYDDSNRIEAVGKKDSNGKRTGSWIFFHESLERSAAGKFSDAGEKEGIWTYYHSEGNVKSVENYTTGEVTVYFKDGAKSQHFFLKNDQIHGDVELFHACGGLKEKLQYAEGKRHGPGVVYYPNGQKDVTYTYADNKFTGEYLSYFENGILFAKSNYVDGKLDGPYSEYYASGKSRATGQYLAGSYHGGWKYYHSNGQIERTGSYSNGSGVGEWLYYNALGILTEKRNFNAEGKWHGDNTFYHDNKVHYVMTYKNDLLVKIVYFDTQGKEIQKVESNNGSFPVKVYYPTGKLQGEGAYKKGKLDGVWKYYYPEGSPLSQFTYVNGELQGEGTEYHRNGSKRYVLPYKDDKLHGYFTEYYPNGKVKYEGWYQNGNHEQQWFSYHADGTLESDYYYLFDELEGDYTDYAVDGKLLSINTYEKGLIKSMKYFDSSGKQTMQTREDGNKKIFESKFPNGKIHAQFETACGNYQGTAIRAFPDGSKFLEYSFMFGRRQGKYTFFNIDNKVKVDGQYMRGSEAGEWKRYYATGQLDNIGKYIDGEYDSTWTYYFPHGKLSSTIPYQDGKRNGIAKFNSAEGTPMLEKWYDRDNLVSYRTIKSDGQFGEWTPFKPDAVIVINYPNGTKAYEETFKNGMIEGVKRFYFSSGKIHSEYFYKAGDYEGPYKVYYPNGKLYEKGEYKNDELQGVLEIYNEDGSLYRRETYLNGSRHGKTELFSKGAVVKSVDFFGGFPER